MLFVFVRAGRECRLFFIKPGGVCLFCFVFSSPLELLELVLSFRGLYCGDELM